MAIYLAPGLGIEPRLTESKSVVLPLHNPGTEKNRIHFIAHYQLCYSRLLFRLDRKTGFEPVTSRVASEKLFAVSILKVERETRFELATFTLAR